MAYTNIDDPSAYFQTAIYTGNNSHPRTITNDGNSDLQPDWIWVKQRTTSTNHFLYDSSRTFNANGELATNADGAEGSFDNNLYGYISAATSDGFTVSSGTTNGDDFNQSSREYVAWQWKANGGTVTTTPNGTQTTNNMQMATKHQINSDAGFSICTYQGATSYGSFYHGLGVKPDVVIIKSRTNAFDWVVYHKSLTNTHTLYFNSSSAGTTNTDFFPAEPNTTQVYCKDHNSVFRPNGADSYLAYCFVEKQGYSKFGKFFGSGGTGITAPFIYTGFKPAFVMLKRSNTSSNWIIMDNKRNTFNEMESRLFPNLTNAEQTQSTYGLDFLSNGFKLRDTVSQSNASGSTYIYMAFAENPFVTSTGIPTTAR